MKRAAKPILTVLGTILFLLYLALFRIIKKLYRFPAPPFVGWFLDSDVRRRLQSPDKVIERSGIKLGISTQGTSVNNTLVAAAFQLEVGFHGVICRPKPLT